MLCLRLLIPCAAAVVTLIPGSVFSQGPSDAYPSKPVTVVSPYSPGGSGDFEARLYATKISGFMGQQFIVSNKPGAGTRIGIGYVAKSAPDGYTLLGVTASLSVVPAVHKDLSFDVIRDFAPVSLVSKRASVLLVHPSFPAKNFGEYVAYAKSNPGKINFGTSGIGDIIHLAGEWLHSSTNTKVTFVHYKGGGPAIQDLVAGRLDVTIFALVSALQLVKSGKLRAVAMADDKRSKLLPDLPTIAEQGVPGYNFATWFGFLAPVGTPAAIVNKLSEEFAKVAKAPDIAGMMEAKGSTMIGSTPEEFRQVIVTETERWRKVVHNAGIKPEY